MRTPCPWGPVPLSRVCPAWRVLRVRRSVHDASHYWSLLPWPWTRRIGTLLQVTTIPFSLLNPIFHQAAGKSILCVTTFDVPTWEEEVALEVSPSVPSSFLFLSFFLRGDYAKRLWNKWFSVTGLSYLYEWVPCTQPYLTEATPWTVARQAPLSVGFPRQRYWSGLPFPPPGDLPDPGIEPTSPVSPGLQMDSLPAESSGKPFSYLEANWVARCFSVAPFSQLRVSALNYLLPLCG